MHSYVGVSILDYCHQDLPTTSEQYGEANETFLSRL